MTKPTAFSPLADAMREPVTCDGTFAAVLDPLAGYGMLAPRKVEPSKATQAEFEQLMIDHAMAELATGNHTIH